MFTKLEDFAKPGFNFALFFAHTTFDGIERLALLNLAASRSVFESAMANFTQLLGAKDVQSFVSLQKELREADARVLASSGIRHFGDELGDFSDTAALASLVDLVVTVDTSVAHLAGAMGRSAWILLPFNPDWRWQLDRPDSPWYPTARLFRQAAVGGWGPVVDQVRGALAGWKGQEAG